MAERKKAKKETKKGKTAVGTRGRAFEGTVTKKFPTRVVVELERIVKATKYERFYKKKQRLHARIPEGREVEVGDLVQVRESRPVSKIIHFVIVKNLSKGAKDKK